MSQAEELLNSLSAGDTTEIGTGGHIVIGNDRFITVPEELKRIGVQYDHNIETVTFDCPRFWDGLDMSKMAIYINYMLPDGTKGSYIANNVTVDNAIMHFDWTISRNITQIKGTIFFLVCIKKTDAEENEVNHWNSELCKDIYISEGLECDEPITVAEEFPDIITSLLVRMSAVESDVTKLDVRMGAVEERLTAVESDVTKLKTVDVNTDVIDTFRAGKMNYAYTTGYARGGCAIAVNTDIDIAVEMSDYRFVYVNYRKGTSNYSIHYDIMQNSNLIYDAIYANNMFVGVGENGCIRYSNYNDLVSTDESGSIISINDDAWTEITVGDKDYKGIAYGNGMFVAIGDYGRLAYSTDGITWTNETIFGSMPSFETICYGDGKFVALGNRTINAYSEDGITWNNSSSLPVGGIYDVIYANNKYVAVGIDGVILYSEDAITWNTGVSENDRTLYSVTYGNGKFVAVGIGVILYSEDAINWTVATEISETTTWVFYLVKYANNKFTTYPSYCTSEDGINWTSDSSSRNAHILYFDCPLLQTENLAFCNGRFLATSYSKTFGVYSDDGINWSAYIPHCGSERIRISNLISYNGIFMGFDAYDDNNTYISLDGISWLLKKPSGLGYGALGQRSHIPYVYADGKLIFTTGSNIYITEDDGESWESVKLENAVLYDMTYGNGMFVGVGENNIIAYSSDGLNWTTATIDFTLRCITYNDGKFVGVGNNTDKTSFSAYSTDGMTWVKIGIIEDGVYIPKEIIYEKGQYICAYGGAFVFSSFDGETWTKITSEKSTTDINAIVYGKGKFVGHNWSYKSFGYSVYKTEQKTLSDAINELHILLEEMNAVESSVALPIVSATDNGKFLRVVDGVWTDASLTDVSEVGA